MIPPVKTPADVLIVFFDKSQLHYYLQLARDLRAAGLKVELYPDAKKLNKQFKYADQRGFAATLIAGGDEIERGVAQIKWMADGSQVELPVADGGAEIAAWIKQRLN